MYSQRGVRFSLTITRGYNMYHYLTIEVVMRDCESPDDARSKCADLMPCNPDESSRYMESWFVTHARSSNDEETQVFIE
jgi:hypothetical protein